MTDDLEAVRRRLEAGRKRAAEDDRRTDYKGARGRLNLRVRQDLLQDLELLKLAGAGDKNSLCEGFLFDGVAERLAEVRATYDEAAWAVLVARAQAERGGDGG